MPLKFLVLGGGGGIWVFLGGGKCRFYFYGREDFSDRRQIPTIVWNLKKGAFESFW